jgi:hypothetical protein
LAQILPVVPTHVQEILLQPCPECRAFELGCRTGAGVAELHEVSESVCSSCAREFYLFRIKQPHLIRAVQKALSLFSGLGFRLSPDLPELRSTTPFEHAREAQRGIIPAVFEVKKEIPDKRHDPQTALSDETSARPRRARR